MIMCHVLEYSRLAVITSCVLRLKLSACIQQTEILIPSCFLPLIELHYVMMPNEHVGLCMSATDGSLPYLSLLSFAV